jgi:hypothetical protein
LERAFTPTTPRRSATARSRPTKGETHTAKREDLKAPPT